MKMLFPLALALTFLANSPAHAATPENFDLTCVNPSGAVVRIFTEADQVKFQFKDIGASPDPENPNYAANFPLYDGTLTKPMLPIVERSYAELSPLFMGFTAAWPKSQCEVDQARPFLISCKGITKEIEPQTSSDFGASNVSTYQENGEGLGNISYGVIRVQLGLQSNSKERGFFHYFLGFPFNKEACKASRANLPLPPKSSPLQLFPKTRNDIRH